MSEIIRRRLQDMGAEEGPEVVDALRRLAACQGGFTRDAAGVLLQLEDDSAGLDRLLSTLRAWQFVTQHIGTDGQRERYVIDPLVIAELEIDEAAREAHRAYYVALARQHHELDDYSGLEVELPNIQAAFEGALKEPTTAYWVYSACSAFLMQQGYHTLYLDWIQRLAAVGREQADAALWGAIQNSLGIAYQNAPAGDRRENLRRAIAAYQEALQHMPAGTRQPYALAQHNLGSAYADLARIEDRAENLWRAIDAYEAALKFRTAGGNQPRAYAATQHNLGNAYRDLAGVENRAENLDRAVHAYHEALSYYTPQDMPLDYAATQNNLGNAYRDLAGESDRVANLRRAISAYEEALAYRTPQRVPLAYAATQNNLGTAYRALANDEQPTFNLQRAIVAFQEALRHHTPQQSPLDYAAIQNNIGSAYRALAELEDRRANLDHAISAFEDALHYCTPHIAPLDYATTQANLGLAWQDLADLGKAVACWREALRYFQQMGALDKADLMGEWLAQAGA